VTFFLGLTAPVAVLTVVASKRLALQLNRARVAQLASLCLASNASLRTFCLGWEEELGSTFAHRIVHPPERLEGALKIEFLQLAEPNIENFEEGHRRPPFQMGEFHLTLNLPGPAVKGFLGKSGNGVDPRKSVESEQFCR